MKSNSIADCNPIKELSSLKSFPEKSEEAEKFQRVAEYLGCDLNGEAVILSLKNGKYYGLNPVASRIWELVLNPVSKAEIVNAILDEYEVEFDQCKKAVSGFLSQMAGEGLIHIINKNSGEIINEKILEVSQTPAFRKDSLW